MTDRIGKWVRIVLIVGVVTLLSPQAQAAFSGAPIGGPSSATDSKGTCRWTSTLDPNPACQMDSCSWVDEALEAQGYTEASGWDITTSANLAGTITIEKYFAWVTTKPAVTFDGKSWSAVGPVDCWGGAAFALTYTPGEGDPTGGDVHWIQAISTNCPSEHGENNGYDNDDGYYWYLDNGYDTSVPFYPGMASGSTWFFDRAARQCPDHTCPCGGSCDWEAQAFLATWDRGNKKMTIYKDGVWWGFDLVCVPEPATLSLLVLGGLALIRRRRK